MSIACKPRINVAAAASKRPCTKFLAGHHVQRNLATHSSINSSIKASNSATKSPPRKQVTVLNDDGRVRWTQLTAGEKVARATQQSFNAMIVLVGVLATVCTLLAETDEQFNSILTLTEEQRTKISIKRAQSSLSSTGMSSHRTVRLAYSIVPLIG